MGDVFYATNKQTKVTKPNQSDVFYATNKKQGTLKPSISSFAENVSTELKNGIANSKAIAKSKQFNAYVSGNPIPHVNPTKPAKNSPVSGELTLTDKLNIGNISEKLRAGIDLNKTERETVLRVGLDSVMSGKADGTFDLNAADSPNNRARLSRVKAIIAKQKAGKEITENENDTLETFKLLNNYKKMSASENSVMTGDYNENARKMNEGLAGKLYNDTAYGNKHFKVGSKEFTVNEKDSAQVALGNMQQTKNRIKLYADTGAEQYVKGIDTTIGVLTGKSPKEVAAEPDSAYAMASALLKEHFAQRGDKFSSAVQDIVTNMANNAPAMIIGSAAGLAGLPAAAASAVGTSSFAVTVFGNAYKEAVQLGATDNQGKLIAYALADTALECGLEYLIGGIPGVGGVLSGNLISDISKQFSDVFMKAIVKTVGNGAGEFVEEGTQTILAPLLQKWLLGADVETVADNPLEQLSQAAYDGFIGFMSSVFMGAGTQLQGAAVEQNIQEYGKRYKSEIKQSNADIKEIARYFAEVSEKNSDLRKAAEAVAKGDTSDFSVGNMMSLGINYSKNSTEQIYRKVGESVRNSEGGISGLLESYKLLTENGLMFPEKTEGLYSDISATLESGFEVSDEMLGEFAMQVQTYSPRAVMMRELTKEAEVKADTETQPTVKESVFDEVSAQKPEYDLIEDWAYTSKDKTRLTDEQKKIAKIGKALGWDVKFDAVHIKDKNGKTVRGENGMPRRADGSIDIKNKRITIDYENKQPIQFIFKHELTHFGEGSKLYGDFAEAVEKSKLFEKWLGEKTGKQGSAVRLKAQLLNDIMSTRTNAGAAVDISGARAEMIADFVGDALFSDNGSGLEGIIKNADTRERGTIRQFLHDFISYLKKKISGNREISFELSKLEDMFNRMFTDAAEKTSDNQTEKYSIVALENGNTYVKASRNVISGDNISAWRKQITNFFNELLDGEKSLDISTIDGDVLTITKSETANKARDNFKQVNGQKVRMSADEFRVKLNAEAHIDEIAETSIGVKNKTADTKSHDFASNGFTYRTAYFQDFDGTYYRLRLSVGNNGTVATVYNVGKINKDSLPSHTKIVALVGSKPLGKLSNNSISNNDTSVNTNISENTQNDTENGEKYSIPNENSGDNSELDNIAELVRKYDNGEISKEEYYGKMRENWRKAGEKYGTIPEGEYAAEDYGVPNAAKVGAPTRRYVRTVLETGSLTDSMKDQIGAEILQGNFSYSPISDENAIKSADKAIESGEAEKRWKAAIESKNISKKTIAIGERLLADAIKAKDNARVLELSAELSDVLTRAGQVVQSARLLKQMTGAGRLVALQRTVQTLNADLAKRFGDKAPVIQIDENVAQIMAESKTEEEIERAYQEAMQDIADQAQPTLLDKWNAWRYCAMLANPRTHIRNIVGNTIFIPAVRTKDVIATGIERMAQLGNSEVERTKVATVKKEYREFAKNDANSKEVKALLKDQKYDERSQLYKMRRTFKNNVFEFLTSFNGNLLEAEDLLFKNRHYIHALGSFLQARKANLNNVSESLMFEARSYAVKEAQKATFNDESAIANYLKSITQIKDKDTMALKVAKIAIDGVIPFKRTPVNIIRRGIEYSPIGLGKALTAGLYDVKKGKISISEFADGLAAGLTGTGIFAIGLLLSGLGYVNGGFGDDDEDKFKKLNGEQEYSVRVFGKSYTIDWAAPACIPFFIGVETANSFKDGDGVKLSDFTGALWNSLEPVTNLSMLSGIQNTISAAKYSSASETLASIGEDIALSYAMQGIPSLAGSISRTIDPTQRSWYTDKNSSISKFGQEAINNIESKIPGVSYFQAPSIDQWGRIKNRGKFAERLTENFLSPGYYSDIEYDDVNSELKRIIEKTGDTKVVPKKAATSFNVNKKQKFLTAKEYTTFAAAKGQMSFDYVKEFIETPAYKKLTDEQRIEVISGLYEYAGAKAKTTVSDYDLMKSYKTVTNLERNGTSAVYYYISRALK